MLATETATQTGMARPAAEAAFDTAVVEASDLSLTKRAFRRNVKTEAV